MPLIELEILGKTSRVNTLSIMPTRMVVIIVAFVSFKFITFFRIKYAPNIENDDANALKLRINTPNWKPPIQPNLGSQLPTMNAL